MGETGEGQNERRKSLRLQYRNQAVVVDCDSMQRYEVKTSNISPLGMGVSFRDEVAGLMGKDVIVITQTLIMYATIVRLEKREQGYEAGIQAKKFEPDVLDNLLESIGSSVRISN